MCQRVVAEVVAERPLGQLPRRIDGAGEAEVRIGRDFAFGAGREGNLTKLQAAGAMYGFAVQGVDEVKIRGIRVSSSLVRNAIQKGTMRTVAAALARTYFIDGRVATGRRLGPTHPGAVLREDVLPDLRMSVTAFAEKLGVSRQMVHGILAERHSVSPEMAARLGKLLGNGAGVWLRMQQAHDLWQVEHEKAKELARIPTLTAA